MKKYIKTEYKSCKTCGFTYHLRNEITRNLTKLQLALTNE